MAKSKPHTSAQKRTPAPAPNGKGKRKAVSNPAKDAEQIKLARFHSRRFRETARRMKDAEGWPCFSLFTVKEVASLLSYLARKVEAKR